jgi:4-hydroxybenzoate polyprenyltransferase
MVLRFLDYVFLLRPILFFPGWTTALTGYLLAVGLQRHWPSPSGLPFEFWTSVVSFTFLMGAAFVVNQLHDAITDGINDKLFFISRGIIGRGAAWMEMAAFLAAGLFCSFLHSVELTVIYLISAVWFVVLYNFAPFRMKDRAVGSVVANAAMGVSALAFGWWSVHPNDAREFVLAGLPYVLFNTGIYFLTTIPDAAGDEASNKQTVSVRYGVDSVISMAVVCIVAAGATAWLTDDRLIAIVVTLSAPFLLIMVWKRRTEDVLRATKFSLLAFAVVVGVYFPLYYGLIIFFFAATRWYYRKRFGMAYPSFGGS